MAALRRRGELTRTEINDLFKGHEKAARIDAALSMLYTAGMAFQQREETGGRDREVWKPGVAEKAK